jgi:predicted anti-sigma-YlaC factor YlaD
MKGMRSCRAIGELLSRRLDERLGLLERAELGLHLRMCGDCREVERQIDQIHAWSRECLDRGLDDAAGVDTGA